TTAGNSLILMMFNWGTDMDTATLKMRERLDMMKNWMPDGVENPMVFQMDLTLMPIMMLGMGGDMDQARLKSMAEDEVKSRLERVPGVASVFIEGGLEREIKVIVDEHKLTGYGLSLDQIVQTLRADNVNLSAGQVEDGKREYFLRTMGEYQSASELAQVVLVTPQGIIRLLDVAEIVDGFKSQRTINRLNGEPSLSINIQKQSDANTVLVANRLNREIAKLQQELPGEVSFRVMFDQASYIKESINTVASNTVIGGIIAVIVLYLFLRNMRSTLIIGTAIPISIISTFGLIYFGGHTLNMLTMGGLALGVGMMVDNSIVILENIYRYRQLGYSRFEAAKMGASEVGTAVTASTLTTVAVFLPIVFVQGFASQLFRPMAFVVAFSLVSSLIVALALVPMLSSKFLKVKDWEKFELAQNTGAWQEKLGLKYQALLTWALGRRKTVIGLVVAGLIAAAALVPTVGTEFLPGMDAGEMEVNANLAIGTIVSDTDGIARQIEEVLLGIPEITTIFTTVGPTGSEMIELGAAQTERARFRVKLTGLSERNRSTGAVAEEVRQRLAVLPGVEITVREVDPNTEGMGGGRPINIQVRGDDLAILEDLSRQIADRIEAVPGVREAETSFEETRPEVRLVVDRQRAANYGLTAAQIAQAVRSGVQGQVATRLRMAGEEIDIRVMLDDGIKQDLIRIENMSIKTPLGVFVPLKEVAQIVQAQGPVTIERINNVRVGSASADISGRDLGSIMRDIQEVTKDIVVPSGYSIEYEGQNQQMRESFQDLAVALLLAIVLVYMVMASQFESLLHPFIIMFAMPTTFIGIVASLFITGRALSVPAFIGIILLAGIVVNNAIVLVDYINTLRRQGLERNEAILQAGKTRLRPILMTTSTTILALFPLTLGLGEGAEAQAPMATVVVGGLLFSTLITLVFIPVVYSGLDDLANKVKSKDGKKALHKLNCQ
ncbi:MAG: efflux RND transporter permease subunit, partial [Clostridia bacterium]|nr:efflux RND transporter permease subunit [Clostridia bacterium]